MSDSAARANRRPSGTVLATWRDNGSVSSYTHHRLVIGGAGDEFVIFHQTRRNMGNATWSTEDTWEAGSFPTILPEESEQDE